MKKKIQNKSLLIVSIALIVLIGLGGAVKADVSLKELIAEKVALVLGEKLSESLGLGEEQFGASGSRFPNGISADTTSPSAGEVRGTTQTITATSTLQEITLGSRFSGSLSFTSSSTPGGLFTIQNTGDTKLCNLVQLVLSTADSSGGGTGDGGNISFGIATSTATDSFSASGVNLIATSTLASSTAGFFASDNDTGSSGMNTFEWVRGEYINGIFDITNQEGTAVVNSATSSAYDGNVGNYYIHCITR